ncbi:hypothetical protein N8843_00430 [Verrucomicrobia bacterium]|nr:hypothetical protein [Verrucomicrobiota bacterium]
MNINCLDHLNAQTRTPPDRMAFQSYLTDINGNPMGTAAPVNKTIKFIIYESEQGPESKWAEQQVVSVNNGHFSVILGEGTRLNDSSGKQLPFAEVFVGTGASDRFIELTVISDSGGSDQILLPRLRLLPSPYAFMASKVASLDLTDTNVLEGQLGGGNIADGAINSAKILNETIQSADIKDGAVTSSEIASNTIVSANIKDGTVTSADITNSTIVSADIKDGTVTSADITNSTIVSADIKDGTVTSADITNSTIVSADIKDGTIKSADIANGNIGSSQLGGRTFIGSNVAKQRIIRGYITAAGSKYATSGEGWSSKRNSSGIYRLTFSPAFKAGTLPVVTASIYNGSGDDNSVNLYAGSHTGITFVCVDVTSGWDNYEDSGIMFIAIGE